MGRAAIPWSSIDRYAARYGLNADEFERLHFLIRKLDRAFLDYFKEG